MIVVTGGKVQWDLFLFCRHSVKYAVIIMLRYLLQLSVLQPTVHSSNYEVLNSIIYFSRHTVAGRGAMDLVKYVH